MPCRLITALPRARSSGSSTYIRIVSARNGRVETMLIGEHRFKGPILQIVRDINFCRVLARERDVAVGAPQTRVEFQKLVLVTLRVIFHVEIRITAPADVF